MARSALTARTIGAWPERAGRGRDRRLPAGDDLAHLRIAEGKNHQVRRMLLAVGSQAIRLARTRIGGLALDLEEDGWQLLTDREVETGLGYTPRPLPASALGRRRKA